MTTTVFLPDGKTEMRYLGKVTSLPKDTWEELIGATESASINTGGQAIDLKNRRIAISQNGEEKIIKLSSSAIIESHQWFDTSKNSMPIISTKTLEDIKQGDMVLFQEYENSNKIQEITKIVILYLDRK